MLEVMNTEMLWSDVFTSVNYRVSLTILKAFLDENQNLSSANTLVRKLDIGNICQIPKTQFTNVINLGLLIIFGG